ncbi:MAG: LptF/LptG family permease [Puniceicoccales bacterium]|jgi:lipopolysaccharide export system permease protein|nr:LptF/LptG family permease [Puniceicoccales bacterium]
MIHSRHIFGQVFWASLWFTLFFVGILLLGNILRDVLQLVVAGQMDQKFFLRTLLSLVPSVFSYALPVGVLAAVLLVLGRMAASNEILALQTAGISMARIVGPVFLLSALGGVAALSVNFFYGPHALHAYRRSIHSIVREDPLRFVRPRQFIRDFPGHVLYAGGRDGDSLTNLHIWQFDRQQNLTGFLHAQRGKFSKSAVDGSLRLDLRRGTLERPGQENGDALLHFRDFSLLLATEQFLAERDGDQRRLKYMDLGELLVTRPVRPAGAAAGTDNSLSRWRGEVILVDFMIQQHLAMAASVCTFSILGIPIALRMRRTETSIGIVLALFLALGYYFATAIISWMQTTPHCRPDLLIWLPNLVILTVGTLLLWRQSQPR